MEEKIKIIEFYGSTCPYCRAIAPEVDRLAEEGAVEFEHLEVWGNSENKARMDALKALYDENCGGNMIVPSFYDPKNNRLVCNPGTYENLKKWIFEEK